MLVTLTVCAPAPAVTLPGENGVIAFSRGAGVADPGCDDDIYTINPDGSGETQLTSGAACDAGPAWHPDGKRLAFARGVGRQRVSRLQVGPESQFPPCAPGPFFNADIYVMNRNGTGTTGPVPAHNGAKAAWPDWAPDGRGYYYRQADDPSMSVGGRCAEYHSLAATYPPGQSWPGVSSAPGDDATFSPVGDSSAVTQFNLGQAGKPRDANIAVGRFGPGPGGGPITSGPDWDYAAAWSPDGTKLAFARAAPGSSGSYAPADIYVIDRAGTGLTQLTDDPDAEDFPAWSPDGTKLAFVKCCFGSGTTEIFTMDHDGTDQQRLTFNAVNDSDPTWRRARPSFHAHVRPKAATPIDLPLVPAYQECTTPNREHGTPIAFPSCSPPVRQSGLLTVGTADSNGAPTKSVGRLRLRAIAGNPATAADEADLGFSVDITDVRRQTDLADYTSDDYPDTFPLLDIRLDVRMTDRSQQVPPAGANLPHTTQDFELSGAFLVPCAGTADPTIGGTCSLQSTFDAIIPAIVEARRTTFEIDDVRVADGGPDDNLETPGDNTVFAVPGVLVP